MVKTFLKRFVFIFSLIFMFNNFHLFSQLNLYLKAGLNLSSVTVSNNVDGFDKSTGFIPAYHGGIILHSTLDDEYSFETGIVYNVKGYKMDVSGINIHTYSTYIEIPIYFSYKLPSFSYFTTNNINIKVGPYYAFAIKELIRNSIMKKNVKGQIGKNQDAGDTLKPNDIGINLGVDYFRKNIILGLNLGIGLLNNRPGGGKGNAVRNLSSQFSLGYILNKNNDKTKEE